MLAALGSALELALLVFLGLVCVGTAGGTSLLARTAAADMYPPERRARGISLVLVGAVFGAILGPAVFSPLLSGRDLNGDSLALLWLAGSGFMLVGLALVLFVRPDPKRIAELLAVGTADAEPRPPAPLKEILRRRGVIPSILAAQASFGVMVAVMTLTGAVVVDHHDHSGEAVFPIIGAHVLGMYALVLVVGDLIDRIGRPPALVGGLGLMALSTISLLWIESVPATAARPLWPWPRLEPVLRGGDRPARRLHAPLGARQAARLQRPALRDDGREPRPPRRLRADRDRRRRPRDRCDSARRRSRPLDRPPRLRPAGRVEPTPDARPIRPPARIRARRTPCPPIFCVMKTYTAKPKEIEQRWYLVDAEGQTLGRLATRIADTLRGKRKPQYTPHVDTGDFVVVVNAEKIAVTGNKLEQKLYYRHSGYPGGLRSRTLAEQLERRPTEVIRKAVKGMLPRNRLARRQITKLKVYAGPEHPHEAQNPQPLPLDDKVTHELRSRSTRAPASARRPSRA